MNAFKTIILFSIIIFHTALVCAFAQKEAQNWYFGAYAGISFANGAPVALTNGALSTSEGCASISHSTTGALLLYTDGVNVWNSNHQIMPNGTGLLGNSTSTQSAVIIPDPGDTNRYYIFSPGSIFNGQILSEQLIYSIVDMRLDNGRGNIPNGSKNIVLRNTGISEKITVSVDCAGTGYWVITHHHSNNTFYAYHLTAQGVNTTAVTSQAGTFNQQYDYMIGQLKSSPNGKKIAVAVYHHSIPGRGGLELCDFDIATGRVSSVIVLRNNERFYGTSFSPDNSKLYGASDDIYQYDVTLPTSQQIINSGVQIASLGKITSMQLGPDGKIYAPRGNNLAVIHQPNSGGMACNFQDNVVSLGGRSSEYSLPNFIDRPFLSGKKGLTCAPPEATFQDDTICEGEYVEFIEDSDNYPTSWQWSFQGGSPSSYSGRTPSEIYYPTPGTYTAELTVSNAYGSSTISRAILVLPKPKPIGISDIILCDFTATTIGGDPEPGVEYSWEPSAFLDNPFISNPQFTPKTFGPLQFIVTEKFSATDCVTYDTVNINVISINNTNIALALDIQLDKAVPGRRLPVHVDIAIPDEGITSLEIILRYDPKTMFLSTIPLAVRGDNSSLQATSQQIQQGELLLIISGDTPIHLASIVAEFDIFLSNADSVLLSSEVLKVNNFLLKNLPAACKGSVTTDSSYISIAEVCGGDMRQVRLSGSFYQLHPSSPNPLTDDNAEISFSMGLEGYASIILYNSQGEKITTIAEGIYSKGDHIARLRVGDLANGMYFYRMASGMFSETRFLMINR